MEQMSTDMRTNGHGLRDPERIEREIERTRRELAETVAAVAEKANVKRRARRRIDAAKRNGLPVAIGVVIIAAGAVAAWIVLRQRQPTGLEKAKRWSQELPDRLSDRVGDRLPDQMPWSR